VFESAGSEEGILYTTPKNNSLKWFIGDANIVRVESIVISSSKAGCGANIVQRRLNVLERDQYVQTPRG
jgi:hypothetical protein